MAQVDKSALPEEAPSWHSFWNWLLVQQLFHRHLPAGSQGPSVCGYRETYWDITVPQGSPSVSPSGQSGVPVLFTLTALQPCSQLPISLPGCLLLTPYIAFSPPHPPCCRGNSVAVGREYPVSSSVMVWYVYLLTLLFWLLSNVTSAKMSPLWFAWWSQPSHHSLRAGPDLTDSEKSYVVRCLLNKTVAFLKRTLPDF